MVSVIVDHGWLIITIQGLGVLGYHKSSTWSVIRYYSGVALWVFLHRAPFIFRSCFSTDRNGFQAPIYLFSQDALSGFWDRFLWISGERVLWWFGGSFQFRVLCGYRIYTGPLYRTIKSCLRSSGELVLWCGEQCLQTTLLQPNCGSLGIGHACWISRWNNLSLVMFNSANLTIWQE